MLNESTVQYSDSQYWYCISRYCMEEMEANWSFHHHLNTKETRVTASLVAATNKYWLTRNIARKITVASKLLGMLKLETTAESKEGNMSPMLCTSILSCSQQILIYSWFCTRVNIIQKFVALTVHTVCLQIDLLQKIIGQPCIFEKSLEKVRKSTKSI